MIGHLVAEVRGRRNQPKKLALVLQAVEEGSRTSHEIAEATGLTVRQASAQLYFLRQAGLVRRTQRRAKYSSGAGRACFVYELSNQV